MLAHIVKISLCVFIMSTRLEETHPSGCLARHKITFIIKVCYGNLRFPLQTTNNIQTESGKSIKTHPTNEYKAFLPEYAANLNLPGTFVQKFVSDLCVRCVGWRSF